MKQVPLCEKRNDNSDACFITQEEPPILYKENYALFHISKAGAMFYWNRCSILYFRTECLNVFMTVIHSYVQTVLFKKDNG